MIRYRRYPGAAAVACHVRDALFLVVNAIVLDYNERSEKEEEVF